MSGEIWIDGPIGNPDIIRHDVYNNGENDNETFIEDVSGDEDSTFSSVRALSQSDMDFDHYGSPISISNQFSTQILPNGKVRLHSTPKRGGSKPFLSLGPSLSSKDILMANWNDLCNFRPEPEGESPKDLKDLSNVAISSEDSDLETTLIQRNNTRVDPAGESHNVSREISDMSFGSDVEQSVDQTVHAMNVSKEEPNMEEVHKTLNNEGADRDGQFLKPRGLKRKSGGLSTTQVISNVVSEKFHGLFEQTIAL